MRRPDRWTHIALLFLLGCSGWIRLPGGMPRQPDRFKVFEIWYGDQRRYWHAVRIEGDSITGIPLAKSSECEPCRLGMAAAEVDSVRAEGTDHISSSGFSILAAGTIGSLVLFYVIRLAIYGGP